MTKSIFILLAFITAIFASENNITKDNNQTNDKNITKDSNKKMDNETEKNIQKAIEKEKKFKEEQKFYMGDDYNLSEQKVDKKTVDKVPLIEPEYDFDITDVYSD